MTGPEIKRLPTQLLQDGYSTIAGVLDTAMLKALRERFAESSLAQAPSSNFGQAGAFLTAGYNDPLLVSLLTWPPTFAILEQFGYSHPKLHSYYISTKPPGAKALAWHSDLFYEYDRTEPAELFLLYYLQDTNPYNGCLRVVPGSHRWSHNKHNTQNHNFHLRPDEVDVPLQAGDLFIGDRRILHATHANTSNHWRTAITIAYAPDFAALPQTVQALICQNRCLPPSDWWEHSTQLGLDPHLQAILPIYDQTRRVAP